MYRYLLIILAFFTIGAGTAFYYIKPKPQVIAQETSLVSTPTPSPAPETEIRLIFVGDIMLSRSVGELIEKQSDPIWPFRNIGSYTRSADIAFANLENPVSLQGKRVGSIYSFRAKPDTLDGLAWAGIDIVSVANNHIWDYGRAAFLDTLKHLADRGIRWVGGNHTLEGARKPAIFEIRGTKIAFLAYTNLLPKTAFATATTPGAAKIDEATLGLDIQSAQSQSDIVVVSFHWGDEYQRVHNAYQEKIATLAIDSGADLIIGHHPHVRQEVVEYGNGWIAYSLGNFIFDQTFSAETMLGYALEATIKFKKITSVKTQDIAINRSYQPELIYEN